MSEDTPAKHDKEMANYINQAYLFIHEIIAQCFGDTILPEYLTRTQFILSLRTNTIMTDIIDTINAEDLGNIYKYITNKPLLDDEYNKIINNMIAIGIRLARTVDDEYEEYEEYDDGYDSF